jgi:hypothetical protein
MKLLCLFHPQAWQNNYAIPVDPEGETVFEADWPDGKELPDDDEYDSDDLRFQGPKWMQDWSGPFYVEIMNRDELEGYV